MSLPILLNRLFAVVGILLLAGATNFSPTAGAQVNPSLDPCANSPDEHALRACRTSDLETAADELKRVAAELSQSLNEGIEGNAEVLATAQADWERFMRSECKLINFESLSGTAGDIYELDCLSTMTRARIRSLRDMLDSP